MAKVFIFSGLAVIIFVGVLVFSGDQAIKDGEAVKAGEEVNSYPSVKVPDLSFSDFSGRQVSLADFIGKPLVINSWAAWCPFCKKELVDFALVQRELKDQVVFIAINRAESLAVAKEFSDKYGVTDDLVFLLDPDDSFYQTIGGFSMPETVFVDREGKIVDHKRGPMEIEEIRERVEKIID